MNGAPVDWSSKKTPIVTLSLMEAAYVPALETGKSIVWLKHLFDELGFNVSLTLKHDNQATI